jgi:proline iminopeptidase
MVLWGVNSAARAEFDWLFRGGLARFFPQQWQRLCDAVASDRRRPDVVEAYAGMLSDADPVLRELAATEWCRWESATPSWPPSDELAERFTDRTFAYAFARLVTHYVRHDAWLGGEVLLEGLGAIDDVPAVLIQGRFDFQAPLGAAWEIHRRWRASNLEVVDRVGHDAGAPDMTDAIVGAIERFAS